MNLKKTRMDYGHGMKTIREALGMNTSDFAFKCGVTPGVIFRIEENCEGPDMPEIKSILKYIGLDMELYTMFCLEDKDVQEDKREMFRTLQPLINDVVVQLLQDPSKDDEPLHDQAGMADKLDRLIEGLKSLQ